MSAKPKKPKQEPVEYLIGGGWGNSINWTDREQFNGPWEAGRVFHVVGWKRRIPQVGDTLRGEFRKSVIWFRFTKVDRCGDPEDMFFAEVTPIRQEMRKGGPIG